MPKESRRDTAAPRRSGDSARSERSSAGADTSSRRARSEEPSSDRKKVRSGDSDSARDTRRSKRTEEPPAPERSSKRSRRDEVAAEPAPARRSSRRAAESDEDVPAPPRRSSRRAAESDEDVPAPRSSKRRSADDTGASKKDVRESRRVRRGGDDDEPAKGSSKVPMILVGILVLAAIGGGGYYLTLPPDLPSLLASLDKFKAPGEESAEKAKQHPTIKALAAMGSPAIAGCQGVLDDASRKPDARIAAALVLGMLKAEAAMPSMIRAMEVEALGPMVGVALVGLGDTAISALTAAAREAKGPYAMRLVTAIARHKSPTLVAKALGDLGGTHPEVPVRVKAVETLAALKTTDGALALARLTLTDADEVCVAAERGLDGQEDNQLVLAARKLIGGDASERRLAMLLVQGVGAGARELVEQGLMDADVAVAIAAAPGMATIIASSQAQSEDEKRSLASQRASLAERVKVLCGEATKDEDVIQLGKAAGMGKLVSLDEHFRGWLSSDNAGQKIAAIEALSGFGDGMIAGEFIKLSGDRDAKVADTAMRALNRFFQRGRKDWRDFHYGADKVPSGAAGWKEWWEAQSMIYRERDLYQTEKAEGTRLLQERTYDSMKKAMTIFETARERLVVISEKRTAAGDPRGEVTGLIMELNGLIEMSMKNRPVGPDK